MEASENKISENPDISAHTNAKRLSRLLQLIASTNDRIVSSEKLNDKLATAQYNRIKSKLVKELTELLSEYGLTVEVKQAPLKEAA